MRTVSTHSSEGKVAIVSVALRLPGADSLTSFWESLLSGRDNITRSEGPPLEQEHDPLRNANARYVPAYGCVGNTAAFDHDRFGMSAAEALLTDPQQRVLLELADEALHKSALPSSQRARAAVFVGTGLNNYEDLVRLHMRTVAGVDDAAVELGTARDYVAGKVAYRLDLHGMAVNVLAACSTGLIAVHLACRSLLSTECDVALAGVSAIRFPECQGYWAVPGGIGSPDGVCRPFDVRAGGTVPADGAGAVVLKRLDDALLAGDEVLAVIRGSAANNDGRKLGFANVNGSSQERVIVDALRDAAIEPGAVRYVESHGTATRLGDAVEWSALRRVFGRNDCPTYVGAVKGNIGHTREAAGLAGLIKAILCLRHELIPPSANFEILPNDLACCGSPVQPVVTATRLEVSTTRPAVVGVSAFGLGGTNCHVVLEAAPLRPARTGGRSGTVLLSSHHPHTLDADTRAVQVLFSERSEIVSSFAARSQVCHHPHSLRRFLCVDNPDGTEAFSPSLLAKRTRRAPKRPTKLVFAFPGVGSEYTGMGVGLARRYDVFRKSRDEIVELAAAVGIDLAGMFTPSLPRVTVGGTDLRRMLACNIGQPPTDVLSEPLAVRHLALFAIQIAMLDLFAEANLRPSAVVGHSLGEWAAATAAGSFSRTEAVRLITLRAKLIEQAPAGVTLVVAADAEVVARLLVGDGMVIAADNSPLNCAVSGTTDAARVLEDRLREANIVFRRLPARAAFHSPQLRDAAHELELAIRNLAPIDPAIPMASTVSGTWIGAGQLDGAYWASQLVQPVRFRGALQTVAEHHGVIIELGPGNIRSWVSQLQSRLKVFRSLPTSYEGIEDVAVCEQTWAELWLRGHNPTWPMSSSDRHGEAPEVLTPTLRRSIFDPRSPIVARRSPLSSGGDLLPLLESKATANIRRDTLVEWITQRPNTLEELIEKLAAMWCALLGVSEVDDEDHFFEIGGDSLLGVHLIAWLKATYGIEIPGPVVFATGSLHGMAESVYRWISDTRGTHA